MTRNYYDSEFSRDSLGDIRAEIKRGVPFLVVKKALALETCDQIREHAYHLFKRLPNNELVETLVARTDVEPPGTKTRRIFRSVNVLDGDPKKLLPANPGALDHLVELQDTVISPIKSRAGATRRLQIIHYPVGGGFFDWHEHPRLPTNYGLILHLSEKGKDFKHGDTEFKDVDGLILTAQDARKGDLVLFKFDLPHRVSPCDPDEDLCFGRNGRWSLAFPID